MHAYIWCIHSIWCSLSVCQHCFKYFNYELIFQSSYLVWGFKLSNCSISPLCQGTCWDAKLESVAREWSGTFTIVPAMSSFAFWIFCSLLISLVMQHFIYINSLLSSYVMSRITVECLLDGMKAIYIFHPLTNTQIIQTNTLGMVCTGRRNVELLLGKNNSQAILVHLEQLLPEFLYLC